MENEIAFLSRKLSNITNVDDRLDKEIATYEKKRKENELFLDAYAFIRDIARLAVFYPDEVKQFSITGEKVKRCIDIVKELEPDILIKKKVSRAKPYEFFHRVKQGHEVGFEDAHQKVLTFFSQFGGNKPTPPTPRFT